MLKIFNNIMGDDNTNENSYNKKFDALNQGLELLAERKNVIDKLKNNHKLIEGQDNMTPSQTQVNEIDRQREQKAALFNQNLDAYKTKYIEFITKFRDVKNEIRRCKIDVCESTYVARPADDTDAIKTKQKKKDACKAGCHFNLPIIQDCEDKFQKDVCGNTCEFYRTQCNTAQGDENKQSELMGKRDNTNDIDVWNGCCDCNLKSKFSPHFLIDGKKYTQCNSFGTEGEKEACESSRDSGVNSTVPRRYFKQTYNNLSEKNQNLIQTSEEILDLVKQLNDLNDGLISTKADNLYNIQDDNLALETINRDIGILSNPKTNITIDKRLKDKYMLKKSTDLQLYVWGILAFGFGLVAIRKISKL